MIDLLSRYRPFLFGLFTGLSAVAVILLVARRPQGLPVTLLPPDPTPTPANLTVHVTGAVLRPGVYELPPGSRVQEAISAAGGLTDEGDASHVNLAAPLGDGQQVAVPTKDEAAKASAGGSQSGGEAVPTLAPGEKVNINTASAAQLELLPRIGPATAQKIVEYRTAHGDFERLEDIQNVSGIGPSTFEAIKDLITVR